MAFEHYDKCSLLLPMDGENNGTMFKDWSKNNFTVTRSTNVVTSTTLSKFYGSSGKFPGGDTDGITINNAAFANGSDDLLVESWFYLDAASVSAGVWLDTRQTSNGNGVNVAVRHEGFSQLPRVFTTDKVNGNSGTNGSSIVSLNTWHHGRLTYDGTNYKFYIDGSLAITHPASVGSSQYLTIGNISNFGATGWGFNGYIQDFNYQVLTAAPTGDFTPPTRLIGELSNSNAVVPVEDETGTPAERTIIAVPRTYPTRAFGAQSDSNGDFTLRAPATECSVFAIHEGSPVKNDLIHRVTPV